MVVNEIVWKMENMEFLVQKVATGYMIVPISKGANEREYVGTE